MEKFIIAVPIYKDFKKLGSNELVSLTRLCDILGKHSIILFGSTGFDWEQYISFAKKHAANPLVKEFKPEFFRGIKGYNELLISVDFYKNSRHGVYILIYQLDAFVFREMN